MLMQRRTMLTLGILAMLGLGLACSSSTTSGLDGGASKGDADNGGDAAGDAPTNLDASFGFDAGCFNSGSIPDPKSATIYGSCVPHIVPGSTTCNEYGTSGPYPNIDASKSQSKSICTDSSLKGTWSDSPCSRTGAICGCQTVTAFGNICSYVTTSWFFPPATSADCKPNCPTGTVIAP